jgi:hypothetical protein
LKRRAALWPPFSFCLSGRYSLGMKSTDAIVTSTHLRQMLHLCEQEVPNFEVIRKDESALMRFFGVLSRPFNPHFMTRYVTTLGSAVYVPPLMLDRQEDFAHILAHELVHMHQRQKDGAVWFFLRYASPQILATLALLAALAPISLWFLTALLFLLLLLPIPSVGRKNIELDGYTMSLATYFWAHGVASPDLEWYASQFSGAPYYFMWPWHQNMIEALAERQAEITSGKVLSRNSIFPLVYAIFSNHT